MKRQGKLFLLLGALALAAAAYIIISGVARRNAAQREAEAAQAAGQTISVAGIDPASITALSWVGEGESVTLDLKDGVWVYAYDESFPLDTSYVDAMLAAASSIEASRELTDVVDYAQYGLSAPRLVITVSSGGGKTSYDIGNMDGATGEYYLRVEDGDSVYLVDGGLFDAFSPGVCDMAVLPAVPAAGDIYSLTVDLAGEEFTAALCSEQPADMYTDAYSWFCELDGRSIPLSTEAVTGLAQACFAVVYQSCAAYAPDAAALESFGLGDGAAQVTIGHATGAEPEGSFTLRFGGLCPDNPDLCYVYVPSASMVCRADAALREAVLASNLDALRAADVCLMDFTALESLTVTRDGVSRTVTAARDADGHVSYALDGAGMDGASVEEFLAAIRALTADGYDNDSTGAGLAPQISVTFQRSSGTFGEMTLRLLDYSADYSLVEFNGESRLLLAREKTDSLISLAASLGL